MQNDKTKPVLLFTQEQFATYWPQVEPLLASAPVAEEFSPSDILEAALAGQMFVYVFVRETEEGDIVELAMVFTITPSKKFPVVTIITVAGKNLKQHASDFWEHFKGWCVMSGARAIDAYVPERIEGFVEQLGLKKETVHVRLRLQS